MKQKQAFVSIDIGSSMIRLAVIEGMMLDNGHADFPFQIIALNEIPARGFAYGTVINRAEASATIKKLVRQANLACGFEIRSVVLCVSGNRIETHTWESEVLSINGEVKQQHLDILSERARQNAQTRSNDGEERCVIDVIVNHYMLDQERLSKAPLGLHVNTLSCSLVTVEMSRNVLNDLQACFQENNISISSLHYSAPSAAQAVLNDSDMLSGVALLDIGDRSSRLLVYLRSKIVLSQVIEQGSYHAHMDIANLLHISSEDAERLKREYGHCAFPEHDKRQIALPGVGYGRQESITLYELNLIIRARYLEILQCAWEILCKEHYNRDIRAGWVFTGGGARIDGLAELADNLMRQQAPELRPSYPAQISCRVSALVSNVLICDKKQREFYSDPSYSTALGALIAYLRHDTPNLLPRRNKFSIIDFFRR